MFNINLYVSAKCLSATCLVGEISAGKISVGEISYNHVLSYGDTTNINARQSLFRFLDAGSVKESIFLIMTPKLGNYRRNNRKKT